EQACPPRSCICPPSCSAHALVLGLPLRTEALHHRMPRSQPFVRPGPQFRQLSSFTEDLRSLCFQTKIQNMVREALAQSCRQQVLRVLGSLENRFVEFGPEILLDGLFSL